MSEPSARTEIPSLRSLVGHRDFVHADDTLEAVQQRFATSRHDFLAVLDGRHLLGLCTRRDLGTLLGARYGFALNARAPVRAHLTPDAIRIGADDRLTDVLQAIAARRDEHFYDDVLLVDPAGDFLGLVYVRDLVRLQTELLLGNIAEVAAKNRQMEDDLRMAREVQVAMLPREFPVCRSPDGTELRFAQLFEPVSGVSGDFFDVWPISPTAAGIIICDVMGHGVRSALITAMVRAMIEELRPHATEPAALLTRLNVQLTRLLRRTGDMIFVTAAYAVVDAAGRRIAYAQAGHPAPLHWTVAGGTAAPLAGADRIGGPALGLVEDFAYEQVTADFGAGDRVLLFTDGVFEASNEAGEEYGRTRLAAELARPGPGDLRRKLEVLHAAAAGFADGQPFLDDVCLVVCELATGRPAGDAPGES